jgi:hypothetical protein
MFIQVRAGATTRSARLLLRERDEGGYYIKRQDQEYAFILDEVSSPFILKRISDLIPE